MARVYFSRGCKGMIAKRMQMQRAYDRYFVPSAASA